MTTYNGHPSWTYWNVSLWINNDEGLYNLARSLARRIKPRRRAATALLEHLQSLGLTATPDGAIYSIANLIHAMRGILQ